MSGGLGPGFSCVALYSSCNCLVPSVKMGGKPQRSILVLIFFFKEQIDFHCVCRISKQKCSLSVVFYSLA